jgi:proteic killer suppression protein
VDIYFASKKLEKLCSDSREAVKVLGADSARKLRTRLADLQVADTVSELVAGRPHPLTGNRAGQFALDLAGGQRLVFQPKGAGSPKASTALDWKRVTAVEIMFIGDYHD